VVVEVLTVVLVVLHHHNLLAMRQNKMGVQVVVWLEEMLLLHLE
jgi:hypothetical protein